MVCGDVIMSAEDVRTVSTGDTILLSHSQKSKLRKLAAANRSSANKNALSCSNNMLVHINIYTIVSHTFDANSLDIVNAALQ